MRRVLTAVIATALAVLWAVPSAPAEADGTSGAATTATDATLMRYAEHTWASFTAMVDTDSGLPTDQLFDDGHTDVQTSTTNIGAYMWSAIAAERLGIIDHAEVVSRLTKTITTVEGMETYESTGQFYNWYDHRNGAKLTSWPPTGEPLDPILSSVDNAWLATGLKIVHNSVPELAARAGAIYDSMDFGFYYVPDKNRILFHFKPSTGDGPCCYDTVLSESQDRRLHRHHQGRAAAQGVLRPLALLPGHLRLLLAGAEADRLLGQLRRCRRLRRQLHVQRHEDHAQLGRLDVRGADARRCSSRRRPGAPARGGRTTRSPSTRRSTTA